MEAAVLGARNINPALTSHEQDPRWETINLESMCSSRDWRNRFSFVEIGRGMFDIIPV